MMQKLIFCALLLATVPAVGQTKREAPETDGAYYSAKDAAAARKVIPVPGQESATAFKGANTIIVHTTDSAKIAFLRAGQAVITAGYSPTQKDNELYYLLTGFRPISQGNVLRIALRISVKPEPGGASIAFTATVASSIADMWVGGATPITAKVEFRPSGNLRPWNELLRVATLCQSDHLAYAVQP